MTTSRVFRGQHIASSISILHPGSLDVNLATLGLRIHDGITPGGIPVSGGTQNLLLVAYATLASLKDAGELLTGTFYKIIDFHSIYDQPDFDSSGTAKSAGVIVSKTGPLEPLIVFAIDNNALAPQAWSTVYPNDHITYDFSFTETEIKGTPAKGRIALRLDDNGNQAPYDTRGIVLKRYESIAGSGIFNSYKDTGFASRDDIPTYTGECENIVVSPHHQEQGEQGIDDSPFVVANNVFGEGCESINTKGDFYNNTFQTYVYGVTFGHFCRNNVVGEQFYDNFILNNFANNVIGVGFYNNTIGNNFQGNNIADNFIGNDIVSGFQNNTIAIGFMNNSIGNDFVSNIIGENFSDNHINDYFQNNAGIGNNFTDNDIRYSFINNIVLANFQSNITKASVVGVNFTTTIQCYKAYTSEIVIPVDNFGEPSTQCWIGSLSLTTALWTWSGI